MGLITLILRDRIGWFGNHTGYEQLTSYLPAKLSCRVVQPRSGQLVRYAGSAYARWQGNPGRRGTSFSQLEFRLKRRWLQPQVSHVLYLEHHLELLQSWCKAPQNFIGTVHLPPSTWAAERLAALGRLNSALVLYQRDLPFFEQHIGAGRVRFIHHGADTVFFKPDVRQQSGPPRLLYGGVYLRNEPMLAQVVARVTREFPEVRFELLVPRHHRQSLTLTPLLDHPAVTWHAGLSDEALRELYQRCHLLVLPMNDSGANTAVVESLASGLPIVTTDVGGIRDYGGGSLYPVVANNDVEGMVSLIRDYLQDEALRRRVGAACRQFAESTLAWPLIARKHLEAYQELIA